MTNQTSRVAHLPYAETKHLNTSVHSWKPCPPDIFARLLHRYATECADEHGHDALSMTAVRLDRQCTACIYYRPKDGRAPEGTRTPVLMTVTAADGKVITFEHIASDEYPSLDDVWGAKDRAPHQRASFTLLRERRENGE